MTPAQMRLLESSLSVITPRARSIGLSFYERLFELAPDLRPLFKRDLDNQQQKLMATFEEFIKMSYRSLLTVPVTAASGSEVSIPGVIDLAQRHARYGARPEHFAIAKEAIFWSLEKHAGGLLDKETLSAWSRAYDMISEAMIRVMRSEATPPALPDERGRSAAPSEARSLEMLFRD